MKPRPKYLSVPFLWAMAVAENSSSPRLRNVCHAVHLAGALNLGSGNNPLIEVWRPNRPDSRAGVLIC